MSDKGSWHIITMTEEEKLRKIAMLRDMMTWPSKQHITDILQRRIYALQNDIEYGAPFPDVDEVLYRLGKTH